MEGWYVAKAKPQKETYLLEFLSHCGVEVFYPKILQPGKQRGKIQPLFPTYLFCHLDPESSIWPVARWAPGMSYFLNHDGEATCVPDQVVEYLEERVSQWNKNGPVKDLQQGDRVVVLSGAFSGLEGVFQRYAAGRDRCRILLDAMAHWGPVDMLEQDVMRSDPSPPECLISGRTEATCKEGGEATYTPHLTETLTSPTT